MKSWQNGLMLSVMAGMGLYVGAVMMADHQAVIAAVSNLSAGAWTAVLGLSLINYAIRYVRWDRYIRVMSGVVLPSGRHFIYYLAGFALSTTPGKAGEAIRAVYLRNHGVSVSACVGALFVERLLDLLAIAVLAVIGVWTFGDYRWFTGLTLVGIVMLLVALQYRQVWRSRLPSVGARFRALVNTLNTTLDNCAVLLRGRWLTGGLLLGVVSWGGEGIGLAIVVNEMSHALPVTTAVSIYAVAVLVGALSFLPGGLGGTEAVMGLLLVASGAPPHVALAATLVCRLATLWLAVVIGLVAMMGLAVKAPYLQAVDRKEDVK